MVLARFVIGIVLVYTLNPVSIDDYFRLFHAVWWWEHPSFTSSFVWLPGHQYIYGCVIGLTGDTLFAPRVFTLVLHLLTGVTFLFYMGVGYESRLWAMAVVYFSPLSFILGTSPITETLAMFYLALHGLFLTRYIEKPGITRLLWSSLFLFCACTVRYEMWLLIPVYWWQLRQISPVDASIPIKWLVLALPVLFPIVWILHGFANPDGWLEFLKGPQDDHLGPGRIWQALQSVYGWGALLFLAWAGTFFIVKHRSMPEQRFWPFAVYLATFVFALGSLATADSLPSQFTERVFFGAVIMSAIFVGDILKGQGIMVRRVTIAAMALLATAALAQSLRHPLGVRQDSHDVALWINEQYKTGTLTSHDHVVVSKYLPDSAAILIFSNHLDKVHIDGLKKGCVFELLSEYAPSCELEGWSKKVQRIVVWKRSGEMKYVKRLKWPVVLDTSRWLVVARPRGAVFPQEGKKVHPFFENQSAGLLMGKAGAND